MAYIWVRQGMLSTLKVIGIQSSGEKISEQLQKKTTESFYSIALVSLIELFSNNFMDDLEEIWKLRAYIPDPTTPPVLYRNSDAEDVD